jgi:hypothetical protein
MAVTKTKGDLGEAIILADILKRGYKVALPLGEDWSYDLIVLKGEQLEKVQCKYTESKNGVISVKCRSCNNWTNKKYSSADIDWIACYDKTTDKCYYIPSSFLGNGRVEMSLRLAPPKNNQQKKVLFANEFLKF